jgi:hypothetical protein
VNPVPGVRLKHGLDEVDAGRVEKVAQEAEADGRTLGYKWNYELEL